jgi:hypothetical protein
MGIRRYDGMNSQADAGPGRLPVITFRPGSPRRSPSRRLPNRREEFIDEGVSMQKHQANDAYRLASRPHVMNR